MASSRLASMRCVLRPLSARPIPKQNPFGSEWSQLELKDSAYFPKLLLHHRWQGTNKASGIWVLLLTQNCNRSFCRRLMFLSEIFETFESERFLRSLEKFERFLRALGLFALQCCTINIDIIEWEVIWISWQSGLPESLSVCRRFKPFAILNSLREARLAYT